MIPLGVDLEFDAGFVYVFTKDGSSTYKEDSVTISGQKFTNDDRDKKTRLYPLTLTRKVKEKSSDVRVSLAISESGHKNAQDRKLFPVFLPTCVLPTRVPDGPNLPTSLLAHTYIKDGLSELDRLHAKCGDIGIKYLKRAFPAVKMPKQYRCEYCIEGKIHKFAHGACLPGRRTHYEPGVFIDADHSGPYAKSYGGARYSELFLDRGSNYLWAFRMKKRTGHYDVAPLVFADAKALSGRPVQFFHTDGDTVFTSERNAEILLGLQIRQELSAPYDSNTNPFIERNRRTIFEGVCTALVRSNAPSSFWGEAECHKIFTINVMPTVPDPKNPGKLISRRNLLQGDSRPFNLDRLQAFGTMTTCYIPAKSRTGGKHPAQRRSFQGLLLGYEETMPAYRIWDLQAKTIRCVSYNFTICHEGYYPFRDKKLWPEICLADPVNFSPIIDGVLRTTDWRKFAFDDEDSNEIFRQAPGLVVDGVDERAPLATPPPLPPPVPRTVWRPLGRT